MRLRSVLFAAAIAIVGSACFGEPDKAPEATRTPIPTATPFASVPAPVVVTPGASTGGATASTGPTGEQVYVVVAGDSISVIADKFDVPSAQIRALNNLSGNDISIGQRIRIPAKTGATPTNPGTSTTAPNLPSPSGVSTYTIKAGDSAFGIALQFDTSLEALEKANGVARGGLDKLSIGQTIKLPPPGSR